MTIAATYRYDDKAIFVSDFRVTQNRNLHDTCLKFEPFEEIGMGLFLAGDIESWNHIIADIRAHIDEISFENILDSNSTFVTEVRYRVGACRQEFIGSMVGAIGFIVDIQNNRNKVFIIKGEMGSYVNIDEVENNQFVVIGSAEDIPNIHKNANEILTERNRQKYGSDIVDFAAALRVNIKSSFNAAGADSYQKLGVSPVMCIGVLEAARFCIVGEDVDEKQVSNQGFKRKGYSLTKNQNGEVVLQDENKEVVLNSILNMGNYVDNNEIFWDGFSSFDPSSQFAQNGFCYKLHQWYIPEMNFIYRKLYKINFVGHKNLCVEEDILEWSGQSLNAAINYQEQVDVYFILSDESKVNEMENSENSMTLEDTILRTILGDAIFNRLLRNEA